MAQIGGFVRESDSLRAIAMQKVVGSSPIIRSSKSPRKTWASFPSRER
jgi:hypothetical protein